MPEHKEIYERHAEYYERLVAREDYERNIECALNQIRPLAGAEVIELGAGTGRLTSLLAPRVRSIRAYDASAHMLAVAEAKLRAADLANWQTQVADHRALPAADRSADVVISGWSICYLCVWNPQTWRAELARAFAEIQRVLRPGGTIILLETLGTGHEWPHPPDPLADYYAYLADAGFKQTWIRTDYKFASLDEAVSIARFFFGDALAEQIIAKNWVILPECTGLWWKHLEHW